MLFARSSRALVSTFVVTVSLAAYVSVRADDTDAKNFLTIATGSVPSPGDSRIQVVSRQFEAIREYCRSTSRGASIGDMVAKSHSLLTAQQSLLMLLGDFVRVARVQCSRIDDSTLLSLYVLERNAGASHTSTIERLSRNPTALIAKWSSR